MKAWLSRTQLRQRPMLAVYGGLLVLIALAIGGASLTWLTSSSSDRLAVISNFLALGTLLLALVAGIVALAAYSAATGLPNLKVKVTMPGEGPNWFVLFMHPGRPETITDAFTVQIAVRNFSIYAARTPAVVVEFREAYIDRKIAADRGAWTPTESDWAGNTRAFQWDGGPNYAIHGNSTRHLPGLSLQGLTISGEEPSLIVRLLADGYARTVAMGPMQITPVPPFPSTLLPGQTFVEWL